MIKFTPGGTAGSGREVLRPSEAHLSAMLSLVMSASTLSCCAAVAKTFAICASAFF